MVETPARVEKVLNDFADIMSRLMIEHYQRHLAELDLTLPQAQALRVLRRGAVATGQLALELRISAPAISQLTDRLFRKRLIERQAAPGDRRSVLIALSARGAQLVDHFRERRCDIFRQALAQLSDAEQTRVIASLQKVVGALQTYEAQNERQDRG
jgi:DNA-binding MarR family transcriptional regulator